MNDFSSAPPLIQLLGKTVVILGAAREGISTYHFLRAQLPDLHLTLLDQQSLEQLDPQWHQAAQTDGSLTIVAGPEYLQGLEDAEVIFKSPGIPPLAEVQAARARGAHCTSNTQLFFELFPGSTIGVTGTKGKSTTTSAIHHVLSTNGVDAALLGNIGVPPLSALPTLKPTSTAVIELSCHQLAELPYSPHIAVVQNITPEHLDYYPSFQAYIHAKSHIARYQQPNDTIIYNAQYETSSQVAHLSAAKRKIGFSIHETFAAHCFTDQDQILLHGQALLSTRDIPLVGEFNIQNTMPAAIIGTLYGLNSHQITASIRTFSPLPHRLEFVAEVRGVRYYNDSLATTPEATSAAIHTFSTHPVVLIAGGHDRHLEFERLASAILDAPVTALILFSPTGEQIAAAITAEGERRHRPSATLPQLLFVETMADAVAQTQNYTQPGSVVLMSPASASFGRFRDYQDRGEQFRAAVQALR